MTRLGTARSGAVRALGLLAVLAGGLGCAPGKLEMRPLRYELDVRLDLDEHELEAGVSIELDRLDGKVSAAKRRAVELQLHPELVVESVELQGATLVSHRRRAGRKTEEEDAVVPVTHRLIVADADRRLLVKLGYRGRLVQDVEAGEEEDKIHNFEVSAHIGEEGLYLDPGGYWYPRLELPEDLDPVLTLADYRLAVQPVEGFELVAGLEREASAESALRWSSPFPLDGLVLLGGPLERSSRRHGDIDLHAVLAPGKQQVAEDILDASAEYLDRYQDLIGPYPFREFTVLEAFFSSGFAFPTCTQIVGSQLSEYKQYRRHGYLDHELLHNWWGNGILSDPDEGQWHEGLASYAGNYYGYVLDGDEAGARKQRRNFSNFLSAVGPDEDRPLGTFGLDDGAGRGIGYFKAAAVFHMLERKIGREAFFAALRRMTEERMGGFASWDDLRETFERESGTDLDRFFDDWVRGAGAPLLELEAADWRPGADRLTVSIEQAGTAFDLDVPLRLHYGDRFEDVVAAVDLPTQTVEVPCEPEGLTAVELDPDYHLFRKLKPGETMPTSSLTRRGERLMIVVPDGELAPGYRTLQDSYTRSVLGEGDEPEEGHEVLVRRAGEVEAAELEQGNVLVLGSAVRAPAVQALLDRTRSPMSWTGSSFLVQGDAYGEPGQAVLMTVHHPDGDDAGVTVYFGNSPDALANARVLSFYGNSLLVFETPLDAEPAGDSSTGMPRTEVIRRMDFEFHDRIEF